MPSKEVVIGLIKKFHIDMSKLDDFCYEVYSVFKDYALSMAVERPSCSRIIVLGKDFEVRLYVSQTGEGILTLFFVLLPEVGVRKGLEKALTSLLKTLSSMITASNEPIVVVRNIVLSSVRSINTIVASLIDAGVVLESIDRRVVEDFEILTLKGFFIGENLRKYSIMLSFATGDKSELGITIETRVDEALLHDFNMFLNYVKKIYSFMLNLENSLVNNVS
jgi:hypothetical protein